MSAAADHNAAPALQRSLGTLDLVLMSIAAIISFRWLSIAAQIGPSSLTLWVLGMLTFFVPSALTVLELSSRMPGEAASISGARRPSVSCMPLSSDGAIGSAIWCSFHRC